MNYYVDAVDTQGNHTTAIDATGNNWLTTNGTGTQKATISWAAVTSAVSYTVYWTDTGGTFFSHSVPAGTTTLVDDGTVFASAIANGATANPSVYVTENSGIALQSGMAIRLNGLTDSAQY